MKYLLQAENYINSKNEHYELLQIERLATSVVSVLVSVVEKRIIEIVDTFFFDVFYLSGSFDSSDSMTKRDEISEGVEKLKSNYQIALDEFANQSFRGPEDYCQNLVIYNQEEILKVWLFCTNELSKLTRLVWLNQSQAIKKEPDLFHNNDIYNYARLQVSKALNHHRNIFFKEVLKKTERQLHMIKDEVPRLLKNLNDEFANSEGHSPLVANRYNYCIEELELLLDRSINSFNSIKLLSSAVFEVKT
jgi:hypothetical protein